MQVQSVMFKAMSVMVKSKVERLIKSGIKDEKQLFEETMKKPRADKNFQKTMKQSGIEMEVVEATIRSTIKELLAKPEKKSLISRLFKLKV